MSKIKRLAKKTWKNKWSRELITLSNYIKYMIGPCSFCYDASSRRYKKEGDMTNRLAVPRICCFCLLPKYICYHQLGGKNLINIIHKSIIFSNTKRFYEAINYVKICIKSLAKKGKIEGKISKDIKLYINNYFGEN